MQTRLAKENKWREMREKQMKTEIWSWSWRCKWMWMLLLLLFLLLCLQFAVHGHWPSRKRSSSSTSSHRGNAKKVDKCCQSIFMRFQFSSAINRRYHRGVWETFSIGNRLSLDYFLASLTYIHIYFYSLNTK